MRTPTRLGRYELLGHLATGGMAEIHLARLAGEAGFEKTVVVKRLLPELVASRTYVAMFLEEGKLVARLAHPNVCEVHELGRDGAEYFLVMPYLEGVPTSDFMARPRDPDRIAQLRVAAGIVAQACAGLHHAHELRDGDGAPLGLVHRDVSPSNLFVTTSGVVKVLDFGIAKVHGGAETEAGTIKGKVAYMAPEQLAGERLDRRCDVFALGIVAFELATHSRLFKRASDYLSARAILEEAIPRADAVDPAVPRELADVIARALERPSTKRHADARELGAAIEAAMQPHGGVAKLDEIAAALADWHGTELSAMRTRQAKVIAAAQSRAGTVAVADTAVTIARDARQSTRTRNLVVAMVVALAVAIAIVIVVRIGLSGSSEVRVAAAPTSDAAVSARAPASDAASEVIVDARPEPPPVVAVEPPRKPVSQPPKRARVEAKPPAVPEMGTFSIDAHPYAHVYIDGRLVGDTPYLDKPVAAGKHTVVLEREDGSKRTLPIVIQAGRLFVAGNITN